MASCWSAQTTGPVRDQDIMPSSLENLLGRGEAVQCDRSGYRSNIHNPNQLSLQGQHDPNLPHGKSSIFT